MDGLTLDARRRRSDAGRGGRRGLTTAQVARGSSWGRGGRTVGMEVTDRRARRFRSGGQRVAHSSSGHVWLEGLARRPVSAPWNAALGLSSGAAGEPQPVSHACGRAEARASFVDRRMAHLAQGIPTFAADGRGAQLNPATAARCGQRASLVGDRAESEARSATACPGQGQDPPGFSGGKRWPKPDNALSMADRRGGWKGFGALQPQVLAPVQRHWRNPRGRPLAPAPSSYRHHRPRVRIRRTQRRSSRRARSVWRSASARRRQRR